MTKETEMLYCSF